MSEITESALRSGLVERRQILRQAIATGRSTHDLVELIGKVDEALERLAEGSFGLCDVCHDPVEADRLLADPLCRLCLDHLTDAERRSLERDLELASRVQEALLPADHLVRDGWELHYEYEPLGAVSGDYCDVVPDPSGHGLRVFFGDVSGKGVAASILMAQLHAMLRELAGQGLPLEETLRRANRSLCVHSPASSYVTLVAAGLDAAGGVELCNAGHRPPLVRRGDHVVEIERGGLPLGLFPDADFVTSRLGLGVGDLMLLYTDGLTDSLDGQGRDYEPRRLRELLVAVDGRSAARTTGACLDDLRAFRGPAPPVDDLALMAIRREG